MKPEAGCAICIFKWAYERAAVLADKEQRLQFIEGILRTLSHEFNWATNIALIGNRVIDSIYQLVRDSTTKYYEDLKLKNNEAARALLSGARYFVDGGRTEKEKFERACYLATASNVAPIGVLGQAFAFHEVSNIISGQSLLPILVGDVYEAAQKADSTLYITDNSGEVGFDAILIQKLKEIGSSVTLIVKEALFFEDATMDDACFFDLDKLADSISTVRGLFVPSQSSTRLAEVMKQTDLVIAKGTGAYEGVKDDDWRKPTIYMLKVKCKPVAMDTQQNVGSFVVKLVNN